MTLFGNKGFLVMGSILMIGGVMAAISPSSAQTEPVTADAAIAAPAVSPSETIPPAQQAAEIPADPPGHTIESKGRGPRITDMLAEPANIRPLPEQYLVVKKDHESSDLEARLTAARSAMAHGRNEVALELFNDLYIENPGDKRVLIGRAVAMQKMGQNARALSAYETALTSDPGNIEALVNMLGILNAEDHPSAIEKLLQLRGIYPYNADIAAQLGMVYGMTGEHQNALKYLDMADALKPGNPDILYNRAVVYDRMGMAQQAADLYRQIILLAGDDVLDQNFPIEAVRRRLSTIR